jgi:hypothetical protein
MAKPTVTPRRSSTADLPAGGHLSNPVVSACRAAFAKLRRRLRESTVIRNLLDKPDAAAKF